MAGENGLRPRRESVSRVYCQIAGRDITVSQCQTTQGQEECFACAASSRMCEECGKRVVALAETGRCEVCLTIELKKEWYVTKPTFPLGTQVRCQQLDNREILTTTCFNMQGSEECWNCPALSRLCEDCRERPVRIRRAGRCLICAVKEFAPDWSPLEDAALQRILDEEAERESETPAFAQEIEEILDHGSLADVSDDTQVGQLAACWEMAESTLEEELEMQETVERTEETSHADAPHPLQDDSRVQELFPQVRQFVMARDDVSTNLIVKTFHTTAGRAAAMMEALESEGVVGRYPGGRMPRPVLVKQQPEPPIASTTAPADTVAQQAHTPPVSVGQTCIYCGKPAAKGGGAGLCKTCRRRLWGVSVIEDPVKRVPLLEQTRLYFEDRPSFTSEGLRDHLHCGTDVLQALMQYLEREGYVSKTRPGGKPRKVLAPIPPAAAPSDEPAQPEANTTPAAVSFPIAEQLRCIRQLIAIIGSDGRFGKLLQSILRSLMETQKNEEMIARIRELFKQADQFFLPILQELGLAEKE